MTRRTRGSRWVTTWVTGVVLVAFPAANGATAQEVRVEGVGSRLRAVNRGAAALLQAGSARSSTFRALAAAIDRSDLIVYVDARPAALPGSLQLVAATPACRFVRVLVRTPGLPSEQVAWLAHELRHAVEIAEAPEIRDQDSLRRYYQHVGDGGRYTDRAESSAAQAAWLEVLLEMRRTK